MILFPLPLKSPTRTDNLRVYAMTIADLGRNLKAKRALANNSRYSVRGACGRDSRPRLPKSP